MRICCAILVPVATICLATMSPLLAQTVDVAEIRPELRTGFAHAGWKYDRYSEMPSLDANKPMILADLKGPGIIRHIHCTRHHPEELTSRGVVLEIYFDGSEAPAVICPLADFFGDGCGGDSMNFSSKFIECAPWSYNCYFPMPFKQSARVVLRNDTDKDLADYSFVEWENLPEWNDRLGYFHATYARKCFQLSKDSDETFFEVQGTGHILGRQFSVVTDEPLFRKFNTVMEGNNEIDIDGQVRQIDYLGTEDSFTFSWGFQETFAAQRVGMPLVELDDVNRLSIYRFHDHMPIRFTKSLKWHINWQHEKFFTANPKWQTAVDDGGCWVDYATVHYWYQTIPGGFPHQPLPPLPDRMKTMLHPVSDPPGMQAALRRMPVDDKPGEPLRHQIGSGTSLHPGHLCRHPSLLDRPARAERRPPGQSQPRPARHPRRPRQGPGPAVHDPPPRRPPCRHGVHPSDSSSRAIPSRPPARAISSSRQASSTAGRSTGSTRKPSTPAHPPPPTTGRHSSTRSSDYAGKTVGIVVKVSYGGKVRGHERRSLLRRDQRGSPVSDVKTQAEGRAHVWVVARPAGRDHPDHLLARHWAGKPRAVSSGRGVTLSSALDRRPDPPLCPRQSRGS